jgi:hypothetical protein
MGVSAPVSMPRGYAPNYHEAPGRILPALARIRASASIELPDIIVDEPNGDDVGVRFV